jgi:septation ring formation regulator EzrA
MMKEEVWRNLPKTKLPGCYNRLVKLVSQFDDPVASAHADWEEARVNHDRVQAPGVDIIGEVSQSERGWALKDFRLSIGEEDWVVQALVENPKSL